MHIFNVIVYCLVALTVIGVVGLFSIRYEPVTAVEHFEAEILDRRYKGISVANGVPSEGEIRVQVLDGRIVWLPALRYYLDDTLSTACLVQNQGRLTGIETYAPAKRGACQS